MGHDQLADAGVRLVRCGLLGQPCARVQRGRRVWPDHQRVRSDHVPSAVGAARDVVDVDGRERGCGGRVRRGLGGSADAQLQHDGQLGLYRRNGLCPYVLRALHQ